MKTAEEWLKENDVSHPNTDLVELIQTIQLDAMREGMKRAAEITKQYDNKNDTWGGGLLCGKKDQILSAAEQLTVDDI